MKTHKDCTFFFAGVVLGLSFCFTFSSSSVIGIVIRYFIQNGNMAGLKIMKGGMPVDIDVFAIAGSSLIILNTILISMMLFLWFFALSRRKSVKNKMK